MARSGPGGMCGSDGVCEGEHAGFGRRQWRDVLAVGADSRRGHSAARQQRPKSPCTDRDPRGARRYFIMIIVMHASAPAQRTTLDFGNPLAYQYSLNVGLHLSRGGHGRRQSPKSKKPLAVVRNTAITENELSTHITMLILIHNANFVAPKIYVR